MESVTTAWGLIRMLAQTVFDFSLNQKEMEKIQATILSCFLMMLLILMVATCGNSNDNK